LNAPLHHDPVPALLGQSAGIENLRAKIMRLTSSTAHVVITGESGTGKGLIARILHAIAANGAGRLEVVDCRVLAESRFGHEFVGRGEPSALGLATQCLAVSEAQTLFLKNIECLPAQAQALLAQKLNENADSLRVSLRRSLRVIASTRGDLPALCDKGQFLPDLYYTLSVVPLETVPLRDMREDIPLLLQTFLSEAAERNGSLVPPFDGLMPRLLSYAWPGNVRELRNLAVRLVLGIGEDCYKEGDVICRESLSERVDQFEKHIIEHELQRYHGNVTAVSALLAIPKTTLYDKLHKHKIKADTFKSRERA
jgi:two-component system, NtrC family, C4-dicarboxylate transport response regulator DctD